MQSHTSKHNELALHRWGVPSRNSPQDCGVRTMMLPLCNSLCSSRAQQVAPPAARWRTFHHHARPVKPSTAQAPRSSGVLPSDAAASPFAELDLAEITEGLGRTRVRQHVNPLARQHQVVTGPPAWEQVYQQPRAPLVLDLGCGPGRFLLLLHHRRSQQDESDTVKHVAASNYLGLEIRRPLVERANEWSTRLGFAGNVHYCACNATISLSTMLATYPGPLQLVCIQFPDPHFKRRHYKRRIFQPQLVQDVVKLLPPGGELFLQSDVLDVAVAMRNMFEKYAGQHFHVSARHSEPGAVFWQELPAVQQTAMEVVVEGPGLSSAEEAGPSFDVDCTPESDVSCGQSDSAAEDSDDDDYLTIDSQWAKAGWLTTNPLDVPTEREHYVLQQGLPVYRILFVRK